MTGIIYLQLSLPADKIRAYDVSYSEGRLPEFQYQVRLSGSLTYVKDNFGRWVYLRASAHGYAETIASAVSRAIAHLDELFTEELARQNASPPVTPSSLKSEVDDLSSLLGL